MLYAVDACRCMDGRAVCVYLDAKSRLSAGKLAHTNWSTPPTCTCKCNTPEVLEKGGDRQRESSRTGSKDCTIVRESYRKLVVALGEVETEEGRRRSSSSPPHSQLTRPPCAAHAHLSRKSWGWNSEHRVK
jgi:hypothetical protein